MIILEIGRLEPLNLIKYASDFEAMQITLQFSLSKFKQKYDSFLKNDDEKREFEVIFKALSSFLITNPKERCDFLILFQKIFQKINISKNLPKNKFSKIK